MAVLKIDSGSGATTAGTVTIAAPSASTSTLLTCSAAQLAAAWARPLDEIKVRVRRLRHLQENNPRRFELELERFSRWLIEAGLTPAAKGRIGCNLDDEEGQ